jgi:hypothetical protein
MKRDGFLCHAREVKPNVVKPLAEAFENQGFNCWVDDGKVMTTRTAGGMREPPIRVYYRKHLRVLPLLFSLLFVSNLFTDV